MGKRKIIDYGVTQKEFHKILRKVSQPIKKKKSDSGKS